MSDQTPQDLATALAGIARDLLDQTTVQDTLDRIAYHACRTVKGCDHAGILFVRPRGHVEVASVTGEVVRRAIRAQAELGEGPFFDIAWDSGIYRIDDMARETRWPRYVPKVLELGLGGALGYELFSEKDNLGVLVLYSLRPRAFDGESERAGLLFASHAAAAIVSARRDEHMRSAVETRQEIGEAVGILMERHKITNFTAFEILKRTSQHNNVKLREVANTVIRTGEVPEQRR